MSRIIGLQNNFTSGEIDPKIGARVDLQQYYNALDTAQNVVIQPQGGIKKRPGTEYVTSVTGVLSNDLSYLNSDLTTALNGVGDYAATASQVVGRYIWFKPDGTKMYAAVADSWFWNYPSEASISDDMYIAEFDLSTAWDTSTATYVDNSSTGATAGVYTRGQFSLSDDGTKLISTFMRNTGTGSPGLKINTLSTAWDITSAGAPSTYGGSGGLFGVGGYTVTHLLGARVNDAGTKAIIAVKMGSTIWVLSLNIFTAWNWGTRALTNGSTLTNYIYFSASELEDDPSGYAFAVADDGKKVYFGTRTYELDTAWNTAAFSGYTLLDSNPFSPTGKLGFDYPQAGFDDSQSFYIKNDETEAFLVYEPQDTATGENVVMQSLIPNQGFTYKMIPFEFSVDDSYMLIVAARKMYIIKDGSVVEDINGTGLPYLRLTAVLDDYVDEINFTQAADSLIFVHQDMPPQFVQRGAADNLWTVTPLEFDYIPQYPFAYDTHNPTYTITPSAVSGNITITASSVTTDTGTAQAGSSNTITLKAASAYGSDDQPNGMFIKLNSGTGAGQTRHVEDYVAATKVLTVYPAWDTAPDATTQYEVKAFEEAAVGEYISALNGFGRARITEFVSATQVKAYVEIPFFDTDAITTGNWESEHGWEDAWSNTRGWPRSTVFHEGRLFFGGSKQRPSTLWGSRVNDFFNFDPGENLDDAALEATLDTGKFNAIVDLYSGRNLQVFTTGGEFYIPQSLGDPITPSTLSVQEQTSNGCKTNVPVVNIDGSTLFIQRGGKTLSEFLYDDAVAGYASTRISLLASHLLKNPSSLTARKATSTDEGDRVLIVNRDDGSITCFTLLKTEKIVAPSEWVTDGTFLEVGVDVTDTYCVVERVVNNQTITMIERFNENMAVDTGTYSQPTTSITGIGLPHLPNTDVEALLDGFLFTGTTDSNGTFDIPTVSVSQIQCGIPFTATVKTLPYEGRLSSGPIRTFKKRILEITTDLYEAQSISIDGESVVFAKESGTVPQGLADYQKPSVYSGFKTKSSLLGYTQDATITITDSSPYPMNILSLDYKVSTGQ